MTIAFLAIAGLLVVLGAIVLVLRIRQRPQPTPVPDSDKIRCYIASPLGFSEAGRHYYNEIYLPTLAEFVEIVDPWVLTTDQEIADAKAAGTSAQMILEVGRRNTEAICSSKMLIAHLDGQEPDSGTVAEIGYGAGLGLRCYGIRSDFRQSGEHGATVNLQVQSFIHQSGGFIAGSLDELVKALPGELSKLNA